MTQNADTADDIHKDDDDLLLDVVVVGNFKVKPLSFGKFAEVTPLIAKVADRFAELFPRGVDVSQRGLCVAAMTLLPDLVPIMARIVDAKEHEVEALPASEGVQLALAIWTQNQRLFLDFFIISGSLAK